MKKMLGILAGALLLAGMAAPSAYAMTYYPGPYPQYPYQYPYQQYPYQPNFYIPAQQPCYMNPYGYNTGYNTMYLYYRYPSNCYNQMPQYPMYQNYYYPNYYPSYQNYYYQY